MWDKFILYLKNNLSAHESFDVKNSFPVPSSERIRFREKREGGPLPVQIESPLNQDQNAKNGFARLPRRCWNSTMQNHRFCFIFPIDEELNGTVSVPLLTINRFNWLVQSSSRVLSADN